MRKSKHTKEFKESAVQLALNSDVLTKDIAQDLDINPKTLYNWISDHKRANNIETDGRRNTKSKESLDEENQRLRKENKLLKQERDILKKATAYFAREAL